MTAYYNEFDPYAAQWLRNLIDAGHIAPGVVDERSIEDVIPSDLQGFTQCHFFAGIGVWSLALRRAGWPDTRPVWTGSCPCQPFSSAGDGLGFEDPRHLWPSFAWLIKQCAPPVIFGEQVASKAVEPWVDLVHADLEALDYAFGAVPFPSAGVGAPHIRDRLFWVAHGDSRRRIKGSEGRKTVGHRQASQPDSRAGGMGDSDSERVRRITGKVPGEEVAARREVRGKPDAPKSSGRFGRLADSDGGYSGAEWEQRGREQRLQPQDSGRCVLACEQLVDTVGQGLEERVGHAGIFSGTTGAGPGQAVERAGIHIDREPAGPVNGQWRDADWLFCRDGKWRPVEPGTFPLAHGAPSRVGRLRAYGNAINAKAAEEFIAAYLETQPQ